MAQKYRCPVCGATHKELVPQCRLCGQALGPEAVVGTSQESRVVEERRGGIGAIVGVVVLLVIGIVVVAVLLGVVSGGKAIDTAKNKVGVNTPSDGWSRYDYPEGGFSVELPDGTRQTKVVDGTYEAYTFIGKDTLIQVQAHKVLTKEDLQKMTETTDPINALKRVVIAAGDEAEKEMKANQTKIDKREETGAFGVPAIYYETRDAKPEIEGLRTDGSLKQRQIFFIKDGIAYLVTVTSIYPKPEQFDRVLGSLAITAQPGQNTGTTAAPATP